MADIVFKTAQTDKEDVHAAAEDLVRGLDIVDPKLVVLFADSEYDQAALNAAMTERLPKGTKLVGSSTMTSLDNTGYRPKNVVAAAIGGSLEVGIGMGTGLATSPIEAGAMALNNACADLGVRPRDLDAKRDLALVIDDGYCWKKEELLLGILDVNPSITLLGGGASHRAFPPEGKPQVQVGTQVSGESVAVVVLRIDAPWAALRHHAYEPTGERVVITKVDETARRALEIDGRPAVERYAELCDVAPDKLGESNKLWHLSTAIRVGTEYFMRAPWQPLPDGSILFANMLTENTELELMKLADMKTKLEGFFRDEIPRRIKSPAGVLFFECAGRNQLADLLGIKSQLGETFRLAPPAAGMSAAFELYNGFQINSTMTVLALGNR